MYFLAKGSELYMTPDRNRRYLRVRLAQEFHWTLDYIDNLPQQDVHDIFAVMEGQQKAAK